MTNSGHQSRRCPPCCSSLQTVGTMICAEKRQKPQIASQRCKNPSAKRDRVNLGAPGDTGLGKLHTSITDQAAWDESWHQMGKTLNATESGNTGVSWVWQQSWEKWKWAAGRSCSCSQFDAKLSQDFSVFQFYQNFAAVKLRR